MIKEHDCLVLTSDLPGTPLLSGDVGAVVHIHAERVAHNVEFATLTGETVVAVAVLPSQCRPTGQRDINHVRELELAAVEATIHNGEKPLLGEPLSTWRPLDVRFPAIPHAPDEDHWERK